MHLGSLPLTATSMDSTSFATTSILSTSRTSKLTGLLIMELLPGHCGLNSTRSSRLPGYQLHDQEQIDKVGKISDVRPKHFIIRYSTRVSTISQLVAPSSRRPRMQQPCSMQPVQRSLTATAILCAARDRTYYFQQLIGSILPRCLTGEKCDSAGRFERWTHTLIAPHPLICGSETDGFVSVS